MSDDFAEIRFPESISYGAEGGSGWPTKRVLVESGYETVELLTEQPLGRWTVSRDGMTSNEHDQFNAFWMVVRGRGFRFKDWTDFLISTDESRFVSVSTGVWQLAKRYTFGSETFDRHVFKIVSGTFVPTGGSGSIDVNTGRWSGASAPSAASCEFDVPVRFDFDEKSARVISRNASAGLLYAWEGVALREVRVRVGS